MTRAGFHFAVALLASIAACGELRAHRARRRTRGHDSPHNGDSGRGTPWEIHPVTLIELCCWRELS